MSGQIRNGEFTVWVVMEYHGDEGQVVIHDALEASSAHGLVLRVVHHHLLVIH